MLKTIAELPLVLLSIGVLVSPIAILDSLLPVPDVAITVLPF
jgi:hypothetical protein